jgi:hypothetical protein
LPGRSETKIISSVQAPHVFAGYRVSVLSVIPENKSIGETTVGDYRITFRVEKEDTASSAEEESGVIGKVILKSICSAEWVDDSRCADKPYMTSIQVIEIGSPSSAPYLTARSGKLGAYKALLPPGRYALQPAGGNPFPRCETKEVIVVRGALTELDFYCDTGIR